MRLSHITPSEIREKLKDAKAPATFNNKRHAVHHVFRTAIRDGKITVNPAAAIASVKTNNTRVRYLNQYEADEEQRLREAIRELSPNHEPAFDLALYTGCDGENSSACGGATSI